MNALVGSGRTDTLSLEHFAHPAHVVTPLALDRLGPVGPTTGDGFSGRLPRPVASPGLAGGPEDDARVPIPAAIVNDPDTFLRKALDRALATALLLFLAPLALATALAILLLDGRPILFVDSRIGLGGRAFGCWKFRTMRRDPGALERYLAENPDEAAMYAESRKLTNDPRITALGRRLRNWSIDEAPQLWNVIRGEMSLVGPRPLSPGEFAAAGRHGRDLASVRPGLTGLWQVCGRSDVSPGRRRALERVHVRRRSLRMDAWILARTVLVVVQRRGAR